MFNRDKAECESCGVFFNKARAYEVKVTYFFGKSPYSYKYYCTRCRPKYDEIILEADYGHKFYKRLEVDEEGNLIK